MNKRLVAYFSASGVTAKVAENLADAIGADIFEIQPEVPYTKADLNWMDKKARTTIEMSDPTSRPAIAAKRDNIDEYRNRRLDYHDCFRVILNHQLDNRFNRRSIKEILLAVVVSALKFVRRSCSTVAYKAHLLPYVATYPLFRA